MKTGSGKNVVLGVTGSIAAYKSAEIVRGLRKASLEVHVIMTRNAAQFISPLTLQTLSAHPVITDAWEIGERIDIEHIQLSRQAACLLVAPATANCLAKFATGIADDFLSTFYLALECPVILAPAMNQRMYSHPATRANLQALANRSVRIIEPETGSLACDEEGPGRLTGTERILSEVLRIVGGNRRMSGRRILVTAGPTREPIDPVRYLSNASSGRMGYRLAEEASLRGAEVILISGPTSLPAPAGVRMERVVTGEEMKEAVLRHLDGADAVFKVAAVADFRPRKSFPEKWKRSKGVPAVEWEQTVDILSEVSKRRKSQILVGFAAETENVAENGKRKLEEKGLDLLVACDISRGGIGTEDAAMMFIEPGGKVTDLPVLAKQEIAARLLDWLEGRWK